MTRLTAEILGLLYMAPSSFAAVYGYLSRNELPHADVRCTWELVQELIRRDLVVAYSTTYETLTPIPDDASYALVEYEYWLGRYAAVPIPVEETAVDPVGIWLELRQAGRELALELNDVLGDSGLLEWHLEATAERAFVFAKDEQAARDALELWAEASNARIQRAFCEEITFFRTARGTVFSPAVKLIAEWLPK